MSRKERVEKMRGEIKNKVIKEISEYLPYVDLNTLRKLSKKINEVLEQEGYNPIS